MIFKRQRVAFHTIYVPGYAVDQFAKKEDLQV